MSSTPINKEVLEHLARLARLELYPEEEDRLLKDLQSILGHFDELKSLDTKGVTPMNGGTLLTSIFRDDEERLNTNQHAGVADFPETKDGYLKVPPVFDAE